VSPDVHVPAEGRSVRPPDMRRREREELRAAHAAPGARRRAGETPLLIVAALVLAFLIKTFLVQAFFIPSGSMIPTLEIGDRVLVEKVTYRLSDPARGDVIVFRRPGAEQPSGVGPAIRSFLEGLGLAQPDEDIDLIKRVIGLPGESVEITDGVVAIDGRPLAEDYVLDHEADWGPLVVPAGAYFMLGDNRGNSDDSRYSLGTVPRDHVVGKAFVILWPPGNATLRLAQRYPGAGARAD
jgi:signal peptidase I